AARTDRFPGLDHFADDPVAQIVRDHLLGADPRPQPLGLGDVAETEPPEHPEGAEEVVLAVAEPGEVLALEADALGVGERERRSGSRDELRHAPTEPRPLLLPAPSR